TTRQNFFFLPEGGRPYSAAGGHWTRDGRPATPTTRGPEKGVRSWRRIVFLPTNPAHTHTSTLQSTTTTTTLLPTSFLPPLQFAWVPNQNEVCQRRVARRRMLAIFAPAPQAALHAIRQQQSLKASQVLIPSK
ncbi:unnamed protein product, partial [Pylaiella littoralis]